ncbi:MAG: sugar ABC transporter permease YjfF [Lachnospiraceae bacterium]|nr:sugar ABC transporter permease YjfF [Lachnospiraceae bacterium]
MLKMNTKKKLTDTNLLLLITIVVFFVMYIGAMIFLGEGFLKTQTFFNILNANAALLIVSCGMSLVMITGGIDISVGGVAALVSMCCAVYLDHKGGNIFVSILIAVGIGLAFGLVQGFLIAYLDVQPFIVTLAGMFFAMGMTTIVNTNPFNVANEKFVALKDTRIVVPFMGSTNRLGKYVDAYIQIGVVVAILVVILMYFMLKWTKQGRNFYAVGGNSQSALMLGINVKKTKFISYVISGLLAGIGGYVYFLYVGSGSASHASGMEMNAIASSIIGGTMLTGGVGNIVGTLFGVLSLSTIKNIVSSAGLGDAWWTNITIALMLCLFLVIQSVVMARKKRGLKKS